MKIIEDDRNRLMPDYIPSICKKNFANKAAGFQSENKAAWYYELVQAPFLMADFTVTERLKTIKQLTLVFRQSFLHLQHTGKKKPILLSPPYSPAGIKTGKLTIFPQPSTFPR